MMIMIMILIMIYTIVGEAEIYIGKDPYRGTPQYFHKLQTQYNKTINKYNNDNDNDNDDNNDSDNNDSDNDKKKKKRRKRKCKKRKGFSVTCINLLRCAPGR